MRTKQKNTRFLGILLFTHNIYEKSLFLLVIFSFGLGMFNAISTCIDKICGLKALDANKTGILGFSLLRL